MDDDVDKQIGDSAMFAIFAFSLLVIGGIPVTWWRISSGAGADLDIVQPWLPVRHPASTPLRHVWHGRNLALRVTTSMSTGFVLSKNNKCTQ